MLYTGEIQNVNTTIKYISKDLENLINKDINNISNEEIMNLSKALDALLDKCSENKII